ncbi:MAG TPA: hypothetical protein VFW73_13285 [Lacipirellulaceae bacterium]|nr:hypothetical protein [Lacipirellulaceae bacterium]
MRVPINRLESIWPKSAQATTEAGKPSWSDTVKRWERNAEEVIVEHSKLAIAAAVAAGLAIGWMVKRK